MILFVGELIEKPKEFDATKEIEIYTFKENYLIEKVVEEDGVLYLEVRDV